MYGVTRATSTVLGVAAAGVLLWLGARVLGPDADAPGSWDYWAWVGLCALAGLSLALSQVLGGWTKWGWPRLSMPVLLFAFLPALIVGGWMIAAFDPSSAWLGEHVRDWSDDIGVEGFVADVAGSILNVSAIALVIGLVAGFSTDTTGPRVAREVPEEAEVVTDEEGRVAPAGASVLAANEETPVRDDSVNGAGETRVVRREDDDEDIEVVTGPSPTHTVPPERSSDT